jgi:hypothetical protein
VPTITAEPTADQIIADINSGKTLTYDYIQDTLAYLYNKYPSPMVETPPREVRDYLVALIGKHVEWEGWICYYKPADIAESTYDLEMSMVQPEAGVRTDIGVVITGVPKAQVQQLSSWEHLPITGPWEKIRFSAEIWAVWPSGHMILNKADIERSPR